MHATHSTKPLLKVTQLLLHLPKNHHYTGTICHGQKLSGSNLVKKKITIRIVMVHKDLENF